jgi:hypothetical protein
MAALRTAYQANSIFNQSTSPQPSDNQRSRLPSDLADPEGKSHDSIRSYSGNQKPLSQEAYLLAVVDSLRTRKIQSVILRSTNAFDQIFLARYLRRAYPNARIVIDGADRLFERESDAMGMAGTMTLTTYPLLELQRLRASGAGDNPGERQFNADYSEGAYIALRLLIATGLDGDGHTCVLKPPLEPGALSPWPPADCQMPTISLPDYRVPSWTLTEPTVQDANLSDAPVTWLSILTRSGYWPIAAMDENALKTGSQLHPLGDTIQLPLEFQLFVLSLLAFSCFHLWCCSEASFTSKPAFLAHFANPGRPAHFILIAAGSVFAALLPLFAGLAYGLFDRNAAMFSNRNAIGIMVLLTCALALASAFMNVSRVTELNSKIQKTFTPAIVGTILCLIFFGIISWNSVSNELLPANRYFTYFRSVHILSRVSPVVPIAVLLLGLYAWFWQSLHGLALFGSDRARLPGESDLKLVNPSGGDRLGVLKMFGQEHAQKTEDCARPLNRRTIVTWGVVFTALVVILVLLSGDVPLRSLGTKFYSKVFFYSLLACVSLMLAESIQLLNTWAKLRELLKFLDRLPLRRTLAGLRGFSWGSVWRMSGNVLDVRYKLLSRQLECLGHTQLTLLEQMKVRGLAGLPADCVSALDDTRARGGEFAVWYAENYTEADAGDFGKLTTFQESAAKAAGALFVNVLIPEWRLEKRSLVLDGAPPSGDSDDDHHKAPPASTKDHVRNAEEFVCLPYLGFVQNILGRMRTIVMSILCLFVAATIAISSYPFDPRQELGGAMIALFVFLGAVILYVYAQMHRDTTLSHITNTVPGRLGIDFWIKLVGVGVVPLLGLLTTIFPGISDFVFSWLQPGLQSIR